MSERRVVCEQRKQRAAHFDSEHLQERTKYFTVPRARERVSERVSERVNERVSIAGERASGPVRSLRFQDFLNHFAAGE